MQYLSKKQLLVGPFVALAMATSANAQTTKTTTIETPKGTATKTITRDDGHMTVEGTRTRASDGATATVSRERTRTEDGVSGSGTQTGFNGQTRSYEFERKRTEDGFTATGTGTDRQGRTYEHDAYGRKTETGRESGRTVLRDGEQVYSRTASATRVDGQIKRDVSVVRDPSFKPRRDRTHTPRRPNRRSPGS